MFRRETMVLHSSHSGHPCGAMRGGHCWGWVGTGGEVKERGKKGLIESNSGNNSPTTHSLSHTHPLAHSPTPLLRRTQNTLCATDYILTPYFTLYLNGRFLYTIRLGTKNHA
jgi:hypothetical protein